MCSPTLKSLCFLCSLPSTQPAEIMVLSSWDFVQHIDMLVYVCILDIFEIRFALSSIEVHVGLYFLNCLCSNPLCKCGLTKTSSIIVPC